jgi:hypothetical protein
LDQDNGEYELTLISLQTVHMDMYTYDTDESGPRNHVLFEKVESSHGSPLKIKHGKNVREIYQKGIKIKGKKKE